MVTFHVVSISPCYPPHINHLALQESWFNDHQTSSRSTTLTPPSSTLTPWSCYCRIVEACRLVPRFRPRFPRVPFIGLRCTNYLKENFKFFKKLEVTRKTRYLEVDQHQKERKVVSKIESKKERKPESQKARKPESKKSRNQEIKRAREREREQEREREREEREESEREREGWW